MESLFQVQAVRLRTSIESILSAAGRRTECARCREEIINEREVRLAGEVLCRSCAGEAYYQAAVADPDRTASPESWLVTYSVSEND